MFQLSKALKLYAGDNNGDFPVTLSCLKPKYISNMPSCPACGRDTYSTSYTRSDDVRVFTFYCQGNHHKDVGAETDYPLYSSLYGMISTLSDVPQNDDEKVRLLIEHNPEKAKQFIRNNPHIINHVYLNETLIQYVIEMQNTNVDMVKFLVENKADLTIKNRDGQTPLQRAKQLESLYVQPTKYPPDQAVKHKKYQEIVKILEKAGAKE
jgi:hypothetical protein